MTESGKFITPFKRQCFVVLGASFHLAQIGLMFGYILCLLPQLRNSTIIPLDDITASWAAALPALGQILGNLALSPLMAKFGRKKTNLMGIFIAILGWACLAAATSLTAIMIGRVLQGISGGVSIGLVPILVSEYASPKNRGAFITLVTLVLASATITVQVIGSYLSWRVTAIIVTAIMASDFVMVFFSPESPSWLANCGMYVECERSFRWLRGDEEVDELTKIIESSKASRQTNGASFHPSTLLKREFYLPVIISFHLCMLTHYTGLYVITSYIVSFVDAIGIKDVDLGLVVISAGITRMVACVMAIFIIRRVKRRTMLFTTLALNILVLLIIAGYAYANEKTPFEYPAAGFALLLLFVMITSLSSVPAPLTILGEISPLKCKGIAVGICSIFSSLSTFLSVKTYPLMEKQLGVHCTFCIYTFILVFASVVVWFKLPETKDKTLQQIEEEFKCKVTTRDLQTMQPLTLQKETD